MGDIAIRVENLGKMYRIGGRQERYKRFTETVMDTLAAPLRRLRTIGQPIPPAETLWALKDVSFEVKKGEVVGIIGRNGAGKSTLLKILSRITEPTEGEVRLHGRVGSLLEVGTGFHPELTGRENIYLNGTILGMKRSEIERKFDEIVAFAEIEKFLDTPVKRYSSGMYVRLAFAVAAHLEPEILVVDEVLAVGDAQFQKKCLGKMDDVAKGGRTVLFVSHNMAAIQNLCQTAILLNYGRVLTSGKTKLVIDKYLDDDTDQFQIPLNERRDRQGTGDIRFVSMKLQNEIGESINSLGCGQDAILKFDYENYTHQDLRNFHLAIGIDNHFGQRIALLSTEITNETFQIVPSKLTSLEIHIKRLPLMPGRYGFTIFSTLNGVVADWIQNAGFFDVEPGDFYNSGKLPPMTQGVFLVDHHFKLTERTGSKIIRET